MRSTGRRDGFVEETSLRILCLALLSAGLMSCMSLSLERTIASRPIEWPDTTKLTQQLQISQGFNRMRDRIEGAMEATKEGAGDIARRVRSRAILATDACFSSDEGQGCDIAAKSACLRANYTDGSALSSSTYVACSGTWGFRAADAPEGVCKTKRRLQAALCW